MRGLVLAALVLAACGGQEPPAEPQPQPQPQPRVELPGEPIVAAAVDSTRPAAPAPALPPGEGAWSNARGFYAVWRPLGGEVPFNEEFDAEVWLFADDFGTQPLADAAVSIDCRMPHHQHGMLHDVGLVPTGGGRYLAEGMLCHMLGYWELYVDVTRGAVTERAQFVVEVE